MRTDSVNLSGLAINTAKKKISDSHGDKYIKIRQYKTKSKSAQEAHEAIRPTYMDKESISGSSQEQRLYELIWKRTIKLKQKRKNVEQIFFLFLVEK